MIPNRSFFDVTKHYSLGREEQCNFSKNKGAVKNKAGKSFLGRREHFDIGHSNCDCLGMPLMTAEGWARLHLLLLIVWLLEFVLFVFVLIVTAKCAIVL